MGRLLNINNPYNLFCIATVYDQTNKMLNFNKILKHKKILVSASKYSFDITFKLSAKKVYLEKS